MIRYIIRRLLWGVVLLLAVIMITFIVFFLLPSVNPAVLRAGPNAVAGGDHGDRERPRHQQADLHAVLAST